MAGKNQMEIGCEIRWNALSLEEWQARFDKITRSTILQSYSYAQAAVPTEKVRARWGLIIINGQEAGLVQLMEAGIFFNLFHAVIIDRGPLWFDGFGGALHTKIFFDEINKQFPKRLGRKRRFIPEIEGGAAAEGILKQCGLVKRTDQSPYQTLWWDLQQDGETARAKLKNGWHGSLKKAERAGLEIEWDRDGIFYPWLRDLYARDKQKRGYGGPSPKLLDNLARFSTQENPMIIGKAQKDGQDIAGVLFLTHGCAATYQIGWSSEQGRQNCAHHLLLWRARSMLKEYNIRELDLGGVNDETAQGIKKFKEGTGADFVRLIGHYH
jgi:hypothetical protein